MGITASNLVPLVGGLVSTAEVFTEKVWTLGPSWKRWGKKFLKLVKLYGLLLSIKKDALREIVRELVKENNALRTQRVSL